jgi:hypothetical protein
MSQDQDKAAHRPRRPAAEDKASRYKYGGYVESPAKLAKALEEPVERNKLRLADQREEIARRARIRR